MRVTAAMLLVCVALLAANVLAQAQAFDVVSVKPVNMPVPYPAGTTGFLPGGRYVVKNTNLLNLLGIAYRPSGPGSLGIDHIDATHVAAWVRTSLFDIEAHISPAPAGWGSDEADQPPLRSMLRDRFSLQVHFEKRDMPVYWMTVARADGALGPNMKPNNAFDCADLPRLRRENPSALPPLNREHPLCTVMLAQTLIAGGSVSMSLLAQALRGPIGAPIIDHTGVTGTFDVDVHYTPATQAIATSDPANGAATAEWPLLITAIQDQLGLRLEQHHEPTDILVIDHVERPTGD